MNKYTLIFGALAAVLLVPISASAHDKNKDLYQQQAQIIADRVANGYYSTPQYPVENCAPRYYPQDQDARYRHDYDRRDHRYYYSR